MFVSRHIESGRTDGTGQRTDQDEMTWNGNTGSARFGQGTEARGFQLSSWTKFYQFEVWQNRISATFHETATTTSQSVSGVNDNRPSYFIELVLLISPLWRRPALVMVVVVPLEQQLVW